jgi:hypothetical protein
MWNLFRLIGHYTKSRQRRQQKWGRRSYDGTRPPVF